VSGEPSIRVALDTSKCRAYGICVGIDPDVFELPNGSPVAVLRAEQVGVEHREDLEDAMHNCPASAIRLEFIGAVE
jgi:ferredoxin